jgi:hypothetical protein
MRLEVLETDSWEEDRALGRKVVALINTYFLENEVSHPKASCGGSPTKKQPTRTKR